MDDNNYSFDWQNGRTLHKRFKTHRNCEKKKRDLVFPTELSIQCLLYNKIKLDIP